MSDLADATEIGALVAQPEGRNLDFELDVPEPPEAARLIAGLANSGGGKIVLGAEGPGKVSGLADPEHAEAVLGEAANLIAPALNLQLEPATANGVHLGVVTVPRGNGLVLGAEGPLTDRGEKGELRVLSKARISQVLRASFTDDRPNSALIEAIVDLISEFNDEISGLNEQVGSLRGEAKHARSWRGQLPGWIVSAVLGALLGGIVTVIVG